MSEHETVRDLLALAAAGAIDPQDQLRIDRHCRECEDCLRQLETWTAFAQGLRHLPQPVVPAHLLERTQARLAHEQIAKAESHTTGFAVVLLSVLGWALSFAIWLLLRLSTGGSVLVLDTNILRPEVWSLGWAISVWASGATAAFMLAFRRRELRRVL